MGLWDKVKSAFDNRAAEAKRRADAEAAEAQNRAEETRRQAEAAAAEARRKAEAAAAEVRHKSEAVISQAQILVGTTIAGAWSEVIAKGGRAAQDVALFRNLINTAVPEVRLESPQGEGKWLLEHPAVAMSILWQTSFGFPVPYPLWTPEMKSDLSKAFKAASIGGSVLQSEPVPNKKSLADEEQTRQLIGASDAWNMYLSYVAQSLVVEINRMVPWSIQNFSAAGLAHLFNSKEIFQWDPLADGFEIKSEHGHVLPSAPNDESRFMFGGIVGGDRRTTINNLLDWCRGNLIHFLGAFNAANCTDQWLYRGYPPVNRMIQGTVITSRPGSGVQHLTAGCWGTTGFLRAVLRTVNIPVRLVTHCTHALPNFIEESLYLSHGDDPYHLFTTARPPMPIGEILISERKYNEWFGIFVKGETQCNNIGRRVNELAIDFLPDVLLETYCEDQAARRTHENGKVRELFEDTHTLKQLEDANLWQRMDTKLKSLGGCSTFTR